MNISRKINNMIDKLNEEEINLPEMSNDEKLVEFLDSIGLQEGHDFCYDEGEILIPDESDADSIVVNVDKLKEINKKWLNITVEEIGKSLISNYVDYEGNKKTCILSESVSQLLLSHLDS